MKMPAPFVQLPVQFDAEVIAREIAALPEDAWLRPQGKPEVRVLPLISVDGSPDELANSGPMRGTAHLARCACLANMLAGFDAVWGRTSLLKYSDRIGSTRHVDPGYYAMDRVRLHFPIVTQAGVRFLGDGVELHMRPGECWAVDTWREHRVISERGAERIHLVANTVGSIRLHELLRNGRARQHEGNWRPQVIAPAGGLAHLRFESTNVPAVMTPWELRERVAFLLGEVRPHPRLASVRETLARFSDDWNFLWARHGTSADGMDAYRGAIDSLARKMDVDARDLQLGNRVAFAQALRSAVLFPAGTET